MVKLGSSGWSRRGGAMRGERRPRPRPATAAAAASLSTVLLLLCAAPLVVVAGVGVARDGDEAQTTTMTTTTTTTMTTTTTTTTTPKPGPTRHASSAATEGEKRAPAPRRSLQEEENEGAGANDDDDDDDNPAAGDPAATTADGGDEEKCYGPVTDDPASLSYYRALYDELLSTDFVPSRRIGSTEVLPANTLPPTSPISGPPTDLAIIRLSAILAFSSSKLDASGEPTLVPRGNGGISIYGDTAGLMLAMHHFNNGDGSIVTDLDGVHDRCPIRFVADFYDSESSQTTAVDVFSHQILDSPDRPPASLFGAWRSAVSVPLAILSGVYEIPQISPLSTSTELDDVTQYTSFSRLIPSDAGTARATVDYFRQQSPELRHLGVLYVNDAYGSAFHQAIKASSDAIRPESHRINVKGSPFSYSNAIMNTDEISLAVKTLADTGYRTFFGVFYDEHFDLVMESAVKYGIAGPGYVWIISDGLTESYLHNREFEAGSDLALAAQGIGILKAEGGRETPAGDSGYDRFVKSWYGQSVEDVEYYNCVGHPETNTMGDPSIYYQAEGDFFEKRKLSPTAGAAFVYDSVVTMGLAACGLLEEKNDGGGGEDPLSASYFDGAELFDAFNSQSFEGASGTVLFDPETTSRDPKSAFFVLYNADGTTEDGTTTFTVQTVSHTARVQEVNATAISWVDMEGKVFTYSDGTTTFPDPLPPADHDMNYLSPGLRAIGLTLAFLIFAVATFFAIWTYRYRKARVIKASQPAFLQMITAGTFIMGSTIVTLSMDDNVASQRGCDVACMLNPWLLIYGFVIAFSALFSKTWRVNKIFHKPSCKRVTVTIKDVILPFVLLLTLNTIVLAVWTAVSPLKFQRIPREGVDQFDRPVASYGTCMAETKDWAPYVAIILALNLTMVILANIQAYQARKITMEYAESKWIGIIMASILQACCIGLPLVILAADEPAANFIVRSGIIFVICMSMLLLMFVPKMGHLKKWKEDKARKERLKQERATARKVAMERAVAMGYTTSTVGRAGGSGTVNTGSGFTGQTVRLSHDHRRVSGLSLDLEEEEEDGGEERMNSSSEGEGKDKNAVIPNRNDEEEALKKVLKDDDAAGHLDVDEEIAIVDAASKNLRASHSPAKKEAWKLLREHTAKKETWKVLKERYINSEDDESDVLDTFSFDDSASTFSQIDDGCLRVMNHPKAESKEVQVLKAQIDHMKLEKLAMHDRIRALRSLLIKNGVVVGDEEMESLTGMSKESNTCRRRNPRLSTHVGGEHNLTSSDLPQRGLDRTFSDGSQMAQKPSMKAFTSTRFGPSALKTFASVRFNVGSNKSLESDDAIPAKAPGDTFCSVGLQKGERQHHGTNASLPVLSCFDEEDISVEKVPLDLETIGQNGEDDLEMCFEEVLNDSDEEMPRGTIGEDEKSSTEDGQKGENDQKIRVEREAALPQAQDDDTFDDNK